MRIKYFNFIGLVKVAAIIIALSLVCACSSNEDTSGTRNGAPVNMRVSVAVTSNPDDIDNYVSSLRILAVERSDGRVIANELYDAGQVAAGNFTLLVRQSKLRLYFIANERASMTLGLSGVLNEKELLSQPFSEEAYVPGVIPNASNPFLMSTHVDVDIPASWDSDDTFVVQEQVSLVRVPAKITFSLTKNFTYTTQDNEYKSVVEVLNAEVIRVPVNYKLISTGIPYTGEFHNPNVSLSRKTGGDYHTNDNWTDVFNSVFVPEHLVKDNNSSNATVVAVTLEHSLVNIKTPDQILGDKTRKVFHIPIKTDAGGYGILRNNHYIVNCSLKEWSDDIQSKIEIMPWDKEFIDVEFDKPRYDWVTYVASLDPVKGNPLITATSPTVSYGFCLKGPKAAHWKASLTNGRHFKFIGADAGSVNPDRYVTISVEAVFPWEEGLPYVRNTDLVITINDKEEIRIKDITQVG